MAKSTIRFVTADDFKKLKKGDILYSAAYSNYDGLTEAFKYEFQEVKEGYAALIEEGTTSRITVGVNDKNMTFTKMDALLAFKNTMEGIVKSIKKAIKKEEKAISEVKE